MAGESLRLTRRTDFPVSGPGVTVGRSLAGVACLAAGVSEVPEAAQVATILLALAWGMFHPRPVTFDIEILEDGMPGPGSRRWARVAPPQEPHKQATPEVDPD